VKRSVSGARNPADTGDGIMADAINIRCRRICNPSSLFSDTVQQQQQLQQQRTREGPAACWRGVAVRGGISHRYAARTKRPIKTSPGRSAPHTAIEHKSTTRRKQRPKQLFLEQLLLE